MSAFGGKADMQLTGAMSAFDPKRHRANLRKYRRGLRLLRPAKLLHPTGDHLLGLQ